jgi:spoIIIJ-associated protein
MTRRFFSGSTLDQAVMMAARHYEIDPQELAYRQIEKRHGFLRTRKAVMIAVDPDQPRREPEAEAQDSGPAPAAVAPAEVARPPAPVAEVSQPAAPEPEAPASLATIVASAAAMEDEDWDEAADEEDEPEPPDEDEAEVPEPEAAAPVAKAPEQAPHSAEHDEELLGAAENATRRAMRFAGIDAAASASSSGERVEVEVEGPDASVLVVEDGKGLLAIQHLLPRMMRGLTGRSSFVRVDSLGFHQQRRERLEALALKEAEAASRSGSARTLPPMAPDERRIVHLILQDAPTVVTESRGSGLHKRVVIRPVSGDGGSDDIEARHGF